MSMVGKYNPTREISGRSTVVPRPAPALQAVAPRPRVATANRPAPEPLSFGGKVRLVGGALLAVAGLRAAGGFLESGGEALNDWGSDHGMANLHRSTAYPSVELAEQYDDRASSSMREAMGQFALCGVTATAAAVGLTMACKSVVQFFESRP